MKKLAPAAVKKIAGNLAKLVGGGKKSKSELDALIKEAATLAKDKSLMN